MQTANENLIGFLKDNPNSNRETIGNGTGLKGLVLFNLLKKLLKEEQIATQGDDDVTYSLVEDAGVEQTIDEDIPENINAEPVSTKNEQSDIEEENEKVNTTVNKLANNTETGVTKKKSAGRDNSKFTFNGEALGKGPLVRQVVSQYVKDNLSITYDELKKIFPDTLLKRFGIFQDEKTAHEIAKKGQRYFFKEEHIIKLKDRNIVICNQFTYGNIQPFLKVAKKLGYEIN